MCFIGQERRGEEKSTLAGGPEGSGTDLKPAATFPSRPPHTPYFYLTSHYPEITYRSWFVCGGAGVLLSRTRREGKQRRRRRRSNAISPTNPVESSSLEIFKYFYTIFIPISLLNKKKKNKNTPTSPSKYGRPTGDRRATEKDP